MNIFYVNHDPSRCAQSHGDKHVLKMILETAQLLSTAHHVLDPDGDHSGIYRKTHENHPCAKWVREARLHYLWAWELLRWLLLEYKNRYDREHATERLLMPLWPVPAGIPDRGFVPPPQAMPDKFKHEDTVLAYRAYYRQKHAEGIVRYTRRAPPDWLGLSDSGGRE